MPVVTIHYKPRPLQRTLHEALNQYRWAVAVCHRRFGKTVCAVNHLIRAAMTCKLKDPRFAYIAPSYAMGKQISWNYLKDFSRPIPGVKFNEAELRVDCPNSSQVRIYGATSPDTLRGIYLDGAVLDEYGMMPAQTFGEVIRPALADRKGWALFLGTPNGKNQFYDLVQSARHDPLWFLAEYKASETGILDPAELKDARQRMTEDEYRQEFECSFEASVRGAIYASELESARMDGRITNAPYEATLPVITAWDLGVGDSTAIWFAQVLRSGEVRLIDYYENSGEGLPHYLSVLQQRGYKYSEHIAPHDIQVKEFASGRSRFETAWGLGLRFNVAPKVPLEDGIHAARMLLPRCYFDATKCRLGVDALASYRRDYNQRLQEFTPSPVHDRYSHAADAFRYLAVSPLAQVKERPRQFARRPIPRGDMNWASG